MDLRLIETFLEAARRASFSGAAKVLQISPAAVSQNIKSLEDRLGTRLFTRTTRSVKLTEEGMRYFQRIEPALEVLTTAAGAIAEARDELSGWVRISSTTAFGRTEILPLVHKFMQLHPNIFVELSLSDQFVDLVLEGFDFGIRAGVLPVNDYVSRLLLPITPIVCASKSYARAHGMPKKIEEIHQHQCVGFRSNASQKVFPWEFRRGKLPIKIDIEPTFIVNDPEALGRAAQEGLGLVQVGSNIALPLVRANAVVTALEAYSIQSRGMYAVYPTRRYVPKRVSLLIEFLTSRLSERSDLVTMSH